ncbi:hypothetical protein U7230_09490 [Carboxydochorda subterranea]|uniref:Uncharacterized protein n=1 Tax=Carboxydichorda subterranea TaxID=3109565 RepID=A0ABZ1BU55_9FIRM|nr:hypothetical protein [Limnochorda sp. L945t]WRP16329.1 hypothetical protein U7230_09490 [Limnochorda sp. L945t]
MTAPADRPPWQDDGEDQPVHPGGEREEILKARPVPREASSQERQWVSGHNPGSRKDRRVRTHRKST